MSSLKPLGRIPRFSPAFSSRRRRLRPWRRLLWLLAACCAVAAAPALYASYPPTPTALSAQWIRGAYHLHSKASDGRGTVEEIARAAKESGLQFAIVTDHNPGELPRPKYEDGVLLLFGAELSTPWGHLVVLGVPRGASPEERQRDPVGWAEALGGFAITAHPVQQRNPWTDLAGAGRALGFELYSYDSLWRSALRQPFSRLIPAIAAWPLQARHGLQDLVEAQPESQARLLDLASRASPKIALCAHDAHGLPGYRAMFDSMALYLPSAPGGLDRDPEVASRAVLAAIRGGAAVCAFRALGEPDGLQLSATPLAADGRRAVVAGGQVKISLPEQRPIRTRVEVGGVGQLSADGVTVRLERPGVAQIEVWALAPGPWGRSEWKPWIVVSPIQVIPPEPLPPVVPTTGGADSR